jgi:hypothetical protein
MALTGVHVTCGYVGAAPGGALLGNQAWSQTMTSAGVTSIGAAFPQSGVVGAGAASLLGFEVTAAADAWVAWGAAPDASQVAGSEATARILVRAGETRNILCRPGDKLAWVAA